MKRTTWFLFLSLLATISSQAQKKADRKTLGNLQAHVSYLASDQLEGRRTGTPGEQLAATYIAGQMKAEGLTPKGDSGYLQTFIVREGREIAGATRLTINKESFTAGEQFVPLPFSAEKTAKGDVLPQVKEPDNIWLIDVQDLDLNPHASPLEEYRKKALEAAKNGANGVIFFNSKDNVPTALQWLDENAKKLTIPALWVNDAISKKLKSDNADGFQISLQVAFKQTKRTGTNVIGYIDNDALKTIVIGAHFDHLGYGEDHNSLNTGEKAIHNGADDNASGIAALLELGRLLKSGRFKSNNFILVAFSGEELGLFGSKYFTTHAPIPMEQVNCMINMDMVGRLDAAKGLQIGGVGTSPAWGPLLQQVPAEGMKLTYDSSGVGPSDHTSFYRAKVPVLFFFTGSHADYHKPTDDADKINYNGELTVIKYIYHVIERTEKQEKLAFTPTKEPQMSTARFSVTLGIMPDYTYNKGGVRVDGVSDNRPAQKAGLLTGDVIVQLGKQNITNLEAYMQALGTFKKGDTTTVVVKRGNKQQQFKIQF
ncbi:PDZ domain-containing protein [Chitinophaga rupis]|uniref:PDZ domain-containing protein n=1 Tax=Chitinophaga rupis TaxID=573321 RepID=A0A1H7JH94_9BACT|nr:M28 family peptidase [Chitinophaga rupis]SEK73766.1 PDZ domain-containing protein [Chitinophaga rupis]